MNTPNPVRPTLVAPPHLVAWRYRSPGSSWPHWGVIHFLAEWPGGILTTLCCRPIGSGARNWPPRDRAELPSCSDCRRAVGLPKLAADSPLRVRPPALPRC